MAGGDCQGVGASGAVNNTAADGAFANVLSSVRPEDFTPGQRRTGELQDVGVASPQALAQYAQRTGDGAWSLFDGAIEVRGPDAEETVNEILWAYEQDPVTRSEIDAFAQSGRQIDVNAQLNGSGSNIANYTGDNPVITLYENDDQVSRYGFDAEIVLHEVKHALDEVGHNGPGTIGGHEVEMAMLAYRLGFNPDKIIVPYD